MPKRCVAAGCDGGNAAGLSLHKFPKNPVTRDQWSKEVAKTRSDWTELSEHSRLCSLHFTKDSYETSVLLAQEMGLPSKKRRLKETAIPTLFPKATEIRAGSMEWACGSIHYCTSESTVGSSSTTRPAVVKRQSKALQIPPSLCSNYERPSRMDAIKEHRTRFNT